MNYFFPVVWLLAKAFSIDEMTMGFQGKHVDKRRITYKNEGDGFQGDALCGDGFTYQVYMRNNPAPRNYLIYVTVCEEYDIPKRDRKTHLEFRKDIALAWINPKEYMADQKQAAAKTPMNRKRKRDDASGVSGITLDSALRSTVTEPSVRTQPTKKLKRTVRISDDALDPTAGKLSCRLDHTLDHIPIRPHNSKVRCRIHRWVGVESQKDVFLCPSCEVNLCVDCYHIFHHTENMVMMKKSLSKQYSKRK